MYFERAKKRHPLTFELEVGLGWGYLKEKSEEEDPIAVQMVKFQIVPVMKPWQIFGVKLGWKFLGLAIVSYLKITRSRKPTW